MSGVIRQKIDRNIMDTIDSSLTVSSLDDLLEASLSQLLSFDHVKKAEVLLFNNRKKLILVATARNVGSDSKVKHEIMAQSWLLDSTVDHTGRRIKITGVSPVFSIPLLETQGLLGFLNIYLDKFQVVDRNELNNFYLFGTQLAGRIKEIKLTHEIDELKDRLQTVTLDNREIQQLVTSLSKELYAISAISTKINQSMDFDKSLRKTMATIRKFFGAAIIVVYRKSTESPKPELSAVDCEESDVHPALLEKLEKVYLKAVLTLGKPNIWDYQLPNRKILNIGTGQTDLKKIIGVPLKSKENIIGAIFLLHDSTEPFNHAGLRLLSGMANIMAMAFENMYLFRENEQKKEEAEFLVHSIARFNENLDLEKTLKSVAERGAEFMGPDCQVYLFSETKVPLIKAEYNKRSGKWSIGSSFFQTITPKAVARIYKLMKSENTGVLIKSVNHLKRIGRARKQDFAKLNIHSLIAIPLHLRKNKFGLLLMTLSKGKRPFTSHDLSFAEALGSAASIAIENARTHTASLEMSGFLEKKISEKTSQIQQIRERQKIRVENRKDIIFRVSKRNRFVFVNKAMEIITGCSRMALYRGDFKAEDVVAPEDRQRVRDSFNKVLTGVLPTVKGLEYRHLNQKGEDHLISLTIYPEKDRLERIIGIEGVGEDITEKKRMAGELKKAKDLALLGEFSSAVAHQIRNPLGNILMGTKLLQKELGIETQSPGRIDPKSPKDPLLNTNRKTLNGIFGNLTEGIHNLNQVVTELLEYTKTLKLSRSSQKIDIIIRDTLNRFQDLIKQNGIVVEKQFDQHLPPLSVDAILLGHVFQNVIHNAIQVMPKGGYLFLFSGFYLQKPGYAFISINDSGPGIRPSEAEKVFHPFYTTKNQGTGLGLSLAHRIIEAHQGMMWVCQAPCHHFVTKPVELIVGGCNPSYGGATIHIRLPIADQK